MALINPLLGSNLVTGAGAFDSTLIGNSVFLNGSDEDINRTGFTLSSDGQKEFIISMWVNLCELGRAQQLFILGTSAGIASFNDDTQCTLNADNTIGFSVGSGGSSGGGITTARLFRDIGWYHLLFTFNSNTSVFPTTSRIQLYVNGELQTGSLTAVPDNQDVRGSLTGNVDLRFGRNTHPSLGYFYKGYYAQVCYLEGKSIQAGDFAVSDFLDTFTMGTNGSQFIPKKDSEIAALATSAGGNSACLDFAASDLGNDISDNNKDFTATNMSAAANQSTHTPSKVYTTWNALRNFASSTVTLSEGNLKFGGGDGPVLSTKAIPSTGKWVVTGEVGAGDFTLGVATESVGNSKLGSDAKGFALVDTGVNLLSRTNNSDTNSTSALSAGNKVIAAFDADTGKLWLGSDTGSGYTYLGGGNPATDSTPTFTISSTETLYFAGGGASSDGLTCDFGQNDFDGTIPSGFESLNSTTLTAPDYQGIDYFDATTYEGNGRVQRVGDFVPFTDSETVANSVIFNDDDSAYLSRTYGTPTNAKKFTVSFWFKAGAGTGDQYLLSTGPGGGAPDGNIYLDHSTGGGELWYADPNDGSGFGFRTQRKFTDSSSWVHFCMGIDTTASSGSRLKVEIDGVDQGQPSATAGSLLQNNQGGSALPTEPSPNQDMNLNKDSAVYNIGRRTLTSGGPLDGYLANYYFIDGEKKQASDFGQLDTSTNRWVPKAYSGNFNDNGWKLAFGTAPGTSNGAGTDTSGENHHWAENNFNSTDQSADTPTKNFNVFDGGLNGAGTLSEGNTQIVTATDQRTTYTTMDIPATGKWYWELDVVNYNTGGSVYLGVVEFDELVTSNNPISGLTKQVIFDNFAGNAYVYSNSSSAGLGTAWCNTPGSNNFNADGDILQFALDQDAGTLFIGNNNTWFRAGGARDSFANATTVGQAIFKTGVKRRFLLGRGGSSAETYAINFGQHPNTFSGSSTTFNADANGHFVYTPPTGYKAVNQDNLDDTASKLTAWAWIKNRDSTDSHVLVDRVRGVGVEVHTDGTTTTPETTNANTVQRFLQRGVQVGSDVQVNTANESYVLWQWLVGNSATTGSTNDSGSIDSSVIAADAGHFSVVSWTGNETLGATIGHGLGGTPEFIIAIARAENGENKPVYHKFMTSDNDHLKINDNNVQGTAGTTIWDVSAMSSTLIGLGAAVQSNSNNGMIAYCFRSVPGVCKVGKYIGNGDNDGPYVNLGFKPRWVMVRSLAANRNWNTLDTTRNPTNIASPSILLPNSTAVDTPGQIGAFDILADGFKPRDTAANSNASGETYIYLAMADIGGNGTLPPIYGR